MTQNRNKVLSLMTGSLSNAIVHSILELSCDETALKEKYKKEASDSFQIALKFRNRINPLFRLLPQRSLIEIRVARRVEAELNNRIKRGYVGVDMTLVRTQIEEYFRELRI